MKKVNKPIPPKAFIEKYTVKELAQFDSELDYDSCYYECDKPSIKITFDMSISLKEILDMLPKDYDPEKVTVRSSSWGSDGVVELVIDNLSKNENYQAEQEQYLKNLEEYKLNKKLNKNGK